MKENKIIVAGGVNGNIGDCKVNSESMYLDSFHLRTIAVNSCTGEIVSDSGAYFDVIPFLFFGAFVLFSVFLITLITQ